MRLMFWNKTGTARALNLHLSLAVSNQHGLRAKEIDTLRYIDRQADSTEGKVTEVRIFNPAKLNGNGSSPAPLTFEDLDKQPGAMYFEGVIGINKLVGRLKDLRVKA